MAKAHEGVVTDPTANKESAEKLCGACHKEIATAQVESLHFDSHGYDTIIGQRLGDAPESHKAWEEAKANHCSSCHTTCGQCHVSQPTSVGGGLISGHQFKRRAGVHAHLYWLPRFARQRRVYGAERRRARRCSLDTRAAWPASSAIRVMPFTG